MLNKKLKNIMFVLLTILLISTISLLNFIIDPYDIFHDGENWYPNDVSLLNIKIKLSKHKKNENLLIGGSELYGTFRIKKWLHNTSYLLAVPGINYKNYYELLKYYLRLHPETKHVYISISYASFYSEGLPVKLEEFKTEKLTCTQFFRILFSATALNDSFKIIYKKLTENEKKVSNIFLFQPYANYEYLSNDKFSEKTIINNYEYINKIIDMLEEKSIKYTFFIVPYNILALSIFYIRKPHKKNIENLKKFIVSRSSTPIYDMAFLNKYTSNDVKKDNYTLYIDYMHPNSILGIKIFKMLFDIKSLDKNNYLILTKDNIDKQIKYENCLIKDYIEKNKTRVNKYKEFVDQNNSDLFDFIESYNFNNYPEEFKKDTLYMDKMAKKQFNKK